MRNFFIVICWPKNVLKIFCLYSIIQGLEASIEQEIYCKKYATKEKIIVHLYGNN